MPTEDIYTLLRNFYGLLVNDFPKTGLITKGIYEVEQVFKTIENLPDDQEHLIRYEFVNFLRHWNKCKSAIELTSQMKKLEFLKT